LFIISEVKSTKEYKIGNLILSTYHLALSSMTEDGLTHRHAILSECKHAAISFSESTL